MKKLLLLALCALFALNAEARTLYVDCRQPNNSRNGQSLRNAKKTIQAAVNVAKKGDTILVYPGSYSSIKTKNKKIKIKSVSGRTATTIRKGNSTGASWCLDLCRWNGASYNGTATSVAGFSCVGGEWAVGKGTGAVIGGTVSNCEFSAFKGSVKWIVGRKWNHWSRLDSTNPKKSKILFCKSKLTGCVLSNCYQNTEWGQLMRGCSVQRSKVIECAGKVMASTFKNSLVLGNRYGDSAGTTVKSGDSDYGTLFDRSKLYNCTLVLVGGGRFERVLERSSAWNTVFWKVPSNVFKKRKTLKNSFKNCYEGGPNPGFVQVERGWISGHYEKGDWIDTSHWKQVWVPGHYEDQWVDGGYDDSFGGGSHLEQVWVDGHYEVTDEWVEDGYFEEVWIDGYDVDPDFRLKRGSRCIDAGKLTKAQKKLVGTKDLAGKKRVNGRAIDMGCYEYRPRYVVKFDSNGGTGFIGQRTFFRDENVRLPSNTFKKKYCGFLGWSTSPSGAVRFKDKASVKNLAADGKTVTLYAIWRPAILTIKFSPNGGTGTMDVFTIQSDGQGHCSAQLPDCSFSRKGCTAYWATSADGTGETYGNSWIEWWGDCAPDWKDEKAESYTINKRIEKDTTLVLHAIWMPQLTITFDPNGGTGKMSPIVVDWRRAAVFCCSFQAPPNCEFVGWNTRADGSGRSYMDRQLYEEGNVHQPPDIVHNDSSLTSIHLYAIWRDWSNWRDLF